MATDTLKKLHDLLVKDRGIIGTIASGDDALKAVNKLAIGATDATLNRQFALIALEAGIASRNGNEAMSVKDLYHRFHDRTRKPGYGRGEQADETKTIMVSYNQAFAELGFMKWSDVMTPFEWALDNIKGTWQTRAATLREIIKVYRDSADAPTAEQMDAIRKSKADKGDIGKVSANMLKSVAKLKVTFPGMKDNPDQRRAYLALREAAKAFANVCSDPDAADDDDWAEAA